MCTPRRTGGDDGGACALAAAPAAWMDMDLVMRYEGEAIGLGSSHRVQF